MSTSPVGCLWENDKWTLWTKLSGERLGSTGGKPAEESYHKSGWRVELDLWQRDLGTIHLPEGEGPERDHSMKAHGCCAWWVVRPLGVQLLRDAEPCPGRGATLVHRAGRSCEGGGGIFMFHRRLQGAFTSMCPHYNLGRPGS